MAKRGRKSYKEMSECDIKIDWNTYGTINGKYSKYEKGERITDFNTFLEQRVFITGNMVRTNGWFMSQQLRIAMKFFDWGVYFAIPKKKNENKTK